MSDQHEHHVTSSSTLTATLMSLLMLTILTVLAYNFREFFGAASALVAFLIAAVKAFLVMAFFMGLKYDHKYNRIIFSMSFVFLLVMFFFCALDIYTRIYEHPTL